MIHLHPKVRLIMKDDDKAQFHLLLPRELHAKIKQRAGSNGRSINMEIVRTLEDSFYRTAIGRVDEDHDEKIASDIAEKVRDIAIEIIKKNK